MFERVEKKTGECGGGRAPKEKKKTKKSGKKVKKVKNKKTEKNFSRLFPPANGKLSFRSSFGWFGRLFRTKKGGKPKGVWSVVYYQKGGKPKGFVRLFTVICSQLA